jgi:hypothetical protein
MEQQSINKEQFIFSLLRLFFSGRTSFLHFKTGSQTTGVLNDLLLGVINLKISLFDS